MMSPRLQAIVERIVAPAEHAREAARARQQQLTKPLGSLGRLEEVAVQVAAIQATDRPDVDPGCVVVVAGDHGVAARGVSPYPSEVTAQMVANFARGTAAINAICRAQAIDLRVVDVGVKGPIPGAGAWLDRRVAEGTADFTAGPAMSEAQCEAAVGVGLDLADELVQQGMRAIGLGEMGIGNTTVAAAITAALTGMPPEVVTGRGTGADDECWRRKVETVELGLHHHAARLDDPWAVLRCLGGLEIATLVGLCLGLAAHRRVVIVDGFISTAAAAIAAVAWPASASFMIAGHRSVEPGHRALLEQIGLQPLLDLQMRLGEGTGAAVAFGVVRSACAALREMATFAEARVSTR